MVPIIPADTRTSVRNHGLTDQEVPDYIRKKIRVAGGSPDVIDTAAISSVHSYSQGNPRLIDNVMTDAMTIV